MLQQVRGLGVQCFPEGVHRDVHDIYYIDYTFTVKGVDFKCDRAYTKSENAVYHSGCYSYTIIHKFE